MKAKKKKKRGPTIVPHKERAKDTARKQQDFLEAYMECGRVDIATKQVGILYQFPYKWQRDDPEFAKAWASAREVAAMRFEDAAVRRSVQGVLKPIYQRGVLVGMERIYSDVLLAIMLKSRIPQYREKTSLEHTGKDGGPIESKSTHGLSDEAADIIRHKILGLGDKK